MGLYGALVVRPAGHPDQVNNRVGLGVQRASKEYVFLLSEVDPDVHLAVERGEPVDWSSLHRALLHDQRPQHAGHAGSQQRVVAAQPALRRSGAHQAVRRGDQPVAGDDPLPQRRHGQLPVPPARQRRASRQPGRARAGGPAGQDLSYLKYDIDVEPGQSLDVLMDWRDVEHWNATTNPIPTQLPAITDQLLVGTDTWFSESGYLGTLNPLPTYITVEQRVRRVLPHRPQPRARASHQLRRNLRRHDDGLPHRPARRLPGEVRAAAMTRTTTFPGRGSSRPCTSRRPQPGRRSHGRPGRRQRDGARWHPARSPARPPPAPVTHAAAAARGSRRQARPERLHGSRHRHVRPVRDDRHRHVARQVDPDLGLLVDRQPRARPRPPARSSSCTRATRSPSRCTTRCPENVSLALPGQRHRIVGSAATT